MTVAGNATFNITNSSVVNTGGLRLARTAGGNDGTIVVDGTGSQLNATDAIINIGQGGDATLTYQNGETGDFTVFQVTSFADPGDDDELKILSGAEVTMGLLQVGTGGNNDASRGVVTVSGAGSYEHRCFDRYNCRRAGGAGKRRQRRHDR